MTKAIQIIPYSPELQPSFLKINKDWITAYFSLEAFDLDQLQFPEENIIAKGGVVLFAREGEDIVGTVGLVKLEEGVFELVKMGVIPAAQGRSIGTKLVDAIIEKAREMQAKKLVLFSNKKLTAALHIYRKSGFRELSNSCIKYERCDVEMELIL